MKKILITLILVGWYFCVQAQTNTPPFVAGSFVGSATATGGNATRSYNINVGSPVPYIHSQTVKHQIGFPYNVLYIGLTFPDGLQVSKGYYTGYVQLNWEGFQNIDHITVFQIYRKKMGEQDSVHVINLSKTENQWKDYNCDMNELYEYTIIAAGIPNEGTLVDRINYVKGSGFRLSSAKVSGRVEYELGGAVDGVSVLATTSENIPSSCLDFQRTGYVEINKPQSIDLSQAFSFQAYISISDLLTNGIMDIEDSYYLFYKGDHFQFNVGVGESVTLYHEVPVDSFIHITCTYDGDTAQIIIPGTYVDVDGFIQDTLYSNKAEITNAIANQDVNIRLGAANNDTYNGKIDEVRIWNRVLTDTEILRDYRRYISFNQDGLVAYHRMNEKYGDHIYDISKTGSTYNENHGILKNNVNWSSDVPFDYQLAYKGVTNNLGDYLIEGIPFLEGGSTYQITPIFAPHEFDPTERTLVLSEGANIHNEINFTDISSVNVHVRIVYDPITMYPVSGVAVKIDGSYQQDANNQLVQTDADGLVSFSVPIGAHYLSFHKNGHTFATPEYPGRDENGDIIRKFFDRDVPLIQVQDTTRFKLVGKVVGGPVQAEKLLGAKGSKACINNLGAVNVEIEAVNQKNINGSERTLTFQTNESTGEYEVFLYPEKFRPIKIESKKSGYYKFNSPEDLMEIDMSNKLVEQYVTDSVFTVDNFGDEIFERIDTLVAYNMRRDWVYRETPSLEVSNGEGGDILSDSLFFFTYEDTEELDSMQHTETIDGDVFYHFGKPIFSYGQPYTVVFHAVEKYVNDDNAAVDLVPITDGVISVQNDLALNNTTGNIEIDENGTAVYEFLGGFPNIAAPYTFSMNFKLTTQEESGIGIPGFPMDCYLLGGRPTGNNFVTTGADRLSYILRDPPGSGSYAFMEENYTNIKTRSSNISHGKVGTERLDYQMGVSFASNSGTPFFSVRNKIETDNYVGLSMEHSYNKYNGYQSKETSWFKERFSTSALPSYVGSEGDIFIGYSTNIVYGASDMIKVIPDEEVPNESTIINSYNGFKLATKTGLRVNPEFNTMFIYTQKTIEQEIIPGLKILRNFYLEHDDYTLNFTDIEDPKYGLNNDDKVWGSGITRTDSGASYYFHPDVPNDEDLVIDSVRLFNNMIKSWTKKLADNEKAKLHATFPNEDGYQNVSFGAGSTYEGEMGSSYDSTNTESWEFSIAAGIAASVGFSVNKFGFKLTIDEKYRYSSTVAQDSGYSETEVVGFVLNDDDPNNLITVDIKKPSDGHGPVFRTKGGQTSCPYEDQDVTKYYDPGKHIISSATMKIEGPQLTCEDKNPPVVPETSPVYFTVDLANVSEARKDNWYLIGVDVASNPNGAKVYVDGSSINSGLAISVPYGQTLQKTVEIHKGQPDVFVYDSIGVYLKSLCEDAISDTIWLTASFEQVCSPVEFNMPLNNWVINTNTGDTMNVEIGEYNLQHEGFQDIYFQYRPTGTSAWFTAQKFSNDSTALDAIFIDNRSILKYDWDMTSIPDGSYDLQLASSCLNGSYTYSSVLSGVKDISYPEVFGVPDPIDGILNRGDNILIRFNESIRTGLIGQGNVEVKGTLVNPPVNHNAYVRYNGISDYSSIPEGISFNDKSFSIELWFKVDAFGDQCLISQGVSPGSCFELGITADKKMKVTFGREIDTIVTPLIFTQFIPQDAWQHVGIAFDYESRDLHFFHNGQEIFVKRSIVPEVRTLGDIWIGQSSANLSDNFKGVIHELRIWSKAITFSEFNNRQYESLSGSEIGLYGYWPMTEAGGEFAMDKAANRHMNVYADWEVDPPGYSWDFNLGGPINFETSLVPIIPEKDYTIEFWFKSSLPVDTVCLFSNFRGDSKEHPYLMEKALAICALPDGRIVIYSKGNEFEAASNNYFDNQWHHFAFALKRRGNGIAYIDGDVQSEAINSQFGGLAGTDMWMGTRELEDDGSVSYNYNYSGKLDELRIWELGRTKMQIELDMYSRLKGDETGLLVYFPFEGYATNANSELELNSSKKDVAVSGEEFSSVADGFTNESPRIKDVRPAQVLIPNIIASDKEIIIEPNDNDMPKLEKSIIEITVKQVEDLFGNRMASAETWTAFVHQNQVHWEDESLSFIKEITQPWSFRSTIKNTGGQQASFEILNLPPWLDVDVASGVINPESTFEFLFTVNPSLNIGNYNEDIILSINDTYDEKLPVTIRVFKTPPDWNVDPTDYPYTMNIVGKVKVSGVMSTDQFDLLAAFVNDSCRGVSNVRYVKEFDSYLVFLSVYGNDATPGEEIKFRIWDASAGEVLDEVSPDDIVFVVDGFDGTTLKPTIFEGTNNYRQEIQLVDGWNWISFNKLSANQNNLDLFLGSLSPVANDQIKTHKDGYRTFNGNTWMVDGTFDSIRNDRMYQLKLSNDDLMIYSGSEIVPQENPIPLDSGWNHIGYLPTLTMDVNEALRLYVADTSDIIKSQYAFSMYDPRVGWLGTLEFLEPGKGYMLGIDHDDTLTYPNSTTLKNAFSNREIVTPTTWNRNYASYSNNMNMVASVDFEGSDMLMLNPKMILGAFVDGSCVGVTAPLMYSGTGHDPFFLTIGEDRMNVEVTFRLFNGQNGKVYRINESFSFVPNTVLGTTQDPVALSVGNCMTDFNLLERSVSDVACYPNPFNQHVRIEFKTNENQVTVEVVNIHGKRIQELFAGKTDYGNNIVEWDGTNNNGVPVGAGVYFVRFRTASDTNIFKITKIE